MKPSVNLRICLVLLVAALSLGCQSLFYFPDKAHFFDPTKIGLQPETVFLKSKTGESIHAWYFESLVKPAKGTLVFFHGNAQNISTHFFMLAFLPKAGFNYLIFDYPGYGYSSGKPDPVNTVAAGEAALVWAYEKTKEPLIIFGHSLGGIVALKTVEKVKDQIPLKKIIIEASFDSYQGVAREALSRNWFTWIFQPLTYLVLSDREAPKHIESYSPTPMLFISGTADRIINKKFSVSMYNKVGKPKDLWLIEGGDHGNLYMLNQGQLQGQFLSYLQKESHSEPM